MSATGCFWFVFWASVGGAIVFVGLAFESLGDKKWYKNQSAFNKAKKFKFLGEILVLAGVFVEVVIAGWVARIEWYASPENQPVSDVVARVTIETTQSETNMERIFTIKSWQIVQANIVFNSTNNFIVQNLNLYASVHDIAPYVTGGISASNDVVLNRTHGFGYEIRFQHLEWPPQFPKVTLPTVREFIDNFQNIEILTDFIPTNTQVVGGHGWVQINGGIQKEFEIHYQTPKWSEIGGGDSVVIVTNFD